MYLALDTENCMVYWDTSRLLVMTLLDRGNGKFAALGVIVHTTRGNKVCWPVPVDNDLVLKL